jgi:hypothetical protein
VKQNSKFSIKVQKHGVTLPNPDRGKNSAAFPFLVVESRTFTSGVTASKC